MSVIRDMKSIDSEDGENTLLGSLYSMGNCARLSITEIDRDTEETHTDEVYIEDEKDAYMVLRFFNEHRDDDERDYDETYDDIYKAFGELETIDYEPS
jgi:hypothetical protein